MGLKEANAWLINVYTPEVNRGKTILRVICAWCGKDLGTKDGEGTSGISHGICKECADRMLARIKRRSHA